LFQPHILSSRPADLNAIGRLASPTDRNFSSDKIFHREAERLENCDYIGCASTWMLPNENFTQFRAGPVQFQTAFLKREQVLATFDLHLGS